MYCSKCGEEYFTTSQEKEHYRKDHPSEKIQKPIPEKTIETETRKCQVCGLEYEANIKFVEKTKYFTCSATCRGKLYRDMADRKLIERCIKNNKLDKLPFTLKRIFDLGFNIQIN